MPAPAPTEKSLLGQPAQVTADEAAPSAARGWDKVGEIAAAYVEGGLSLDDAARTAALRSRALLAIADRGGILSGEADAIEEVRAQLVADGVRVRIVPVDYASRSPHVVELREELTANLAGLRLRSSRIPFCPRCFAWVRV
ncbi:hypothetical protein ACIBL5_25855 [Streptomyces sp. NPDC050516]|uniref:hypothetical protein n=1 Tax=Streptomyces sp. NPDC050516 TaxID=3365621 RepID=UPI00379AC29E